MKHKVIKRFAMLLCVLSLVFAGKNLRAMETTADSTVVMTAEATKDSAKQTDKAIIESDKGNNSNTKEAQRQIADEETPLYAGKSNSICYVLYIAVIVIGASLVVGGVVVFNKYKND